MEIKNLKKWLVAARPFSFTASVLPVFIGAAFAHMQGFHISLVVLSLFVISSVMIHAGTNFINDYYDFINEVDQKHTFGSSGALVKTIFDPDQILKAGYISFAIGLAGGLVLVWISGWQILVLGLLGILAGYGYTAKPIAYKYLGLGEIFVFVFMGILLVTGAYFALTHHWLNTVLAASLPIAFLVTAILYGNNMRDIKDDMNSGFKTVPGFLGFEKAKIGYVFLISSAYIASIILVIKNIYPVWSLIVLLTLPLGIALIRLVCVSSIQTMNVLAFIDQSTAALHLVFGVLLTISFYVKGLL